MKRKWLTILIVVLVFLMMGAFSLMHALGVFNTKGYTAVSHGSHFHYVPDNRDPAVGLSKFPTKEPSDDEVITPTGQIIKKNEFVAPENQ